LGGVGFITTLGVSDFLSVSGSPIEYFLHNTRKLGIPVETVQVLLKILLK